MFMQKHVIIYKLHFKKMRLKNELYKNRLFVYFGANLLNDAPCLEIPPVIDNYEKKKIQKIIEKAKI